MHDCRCGLQFFANLVSGDNIKFVAWLDDEHRAAFGRNEYPVAHCDRCGLILTADSQSLLTVDWFAGGRIHASDEAAFFDEVQFIVLHDG